MFKKDLEKIERTQINQRYSNENFDLEIYGIENGVISCCFSNSFYINLLYPSIEIKFIINGEEKKYPLVSNIQFNNLVLELNFENPVINYIEKNNEHKAKYDFNNYVELYYKNNNSINYIYIK